MVYLTCIRHRSYQRKHIDVCRRCADNDNCDAYQTFAATEPPVSQESAQPSHPQKAPFSIHVFLDELVGIRSLVAELHEHHERQNLPAPKCSLDMKTLADFTKAELESIRNLC